MAEQDRSLAQRILDLAVFAPAGLLLTVAEDLPGLAEKGRVQIEGQLANARAVGQLVVAMGQRKLTGAARPTAAPAPTSRSQPAAPAEVTLVTVETFEAEPVVLAIPDYDNLSASQVVRRLDGLAPTELQAIARHEAATRGRRTILHRVHQLLAEPGAAS